jgi:phosphatidylglycerol:prolipoprotein diacylglycerol transferase
VFPVLFELFGLSVHAYGFFIALGYLSSLVIIFYLAHKRSLPSGPLFDLAFLAIISGIIGARVFFIFINLDYYKQFPGEIFYIWKGGLVFYGGLIFAIPTCALYIRLRKLQLWKNLDLLAPALAIGHAFGRIGCLGAGCCHGSACEWPWAVRLNTDLVDPILRNVPLHPTQLYEALSLFILSGGLIYLILRKKLLPGVVACVYFIAYALIRILVETLRGDQIRGFVIEAWLSTSQFISILLFFVGFFCLWRIVRRNH